MRRDLGGFDQFFGNFTEERSQHPDGQRKIQAHIQDDERNPRTAQTERAGDEPNRQDDADKRQELRRDEEEQDVFRFGNWLNGERIGSRDRKHHHENRGYPHNDHRVGERFACRQDIRGLISDCTVAIERRIKKQLGIGVGIELLFEAVQHHPEDREKEEQSYKPGKYAEEQSLDATLAGARRSIRTFTTDLSRFLNYVSVVFAAMVQPSSSSRLVSVRRPIVVKMMVKITTTME